MRNYIFVTLLISFATHAENAKPGDYISFVACPVVRDTTTVPCWYGEYRGVNYFLGIQQDIGADWYPPQLKHKVLVEGIISDEQVCGATKLDDIHTSVLPELSLECNTILPAEPSILAPHAERGPGPNNEEPGNRPPRPRPPPIRPPFSKREFTLYYDFEGVQIYNREFTALRQAINYATASKAKSLNAIVYRGSALLSSGETIYETEDRVRERALGIEKWLASVDLSDKTKISVRIDQKPFKASGKNDYLNRRVELIVIP